MNKLYLFNNFINNVFFFFSRITAKIDDDMLTYYCNEDLFLLEVTVVNKDLYDITFVELSD